MGHEMAAFQPLAGAYVLRCHFLSDAGKVPCFPQGQEVLYV